ncbi:hypothetical protein [Leptolyngbya sp. 7M]|uniref:hypothetical protein n=1 Tax=Leptolyngbya sp. 7M TaxID=2812896 RepID=UPI001B8AB678|nr:hypothetical protein [Leptolyngbya sp. 7M]QYO65247.1 hypothetical protein JVX88_00230 [Leptolyngbya sp. 7M]
MDIPERENGTSIHKTLLGWELKVGRRRIACPDITMARYLSVFARCGCRSIAVPYDITEIPRLVDSLETSWDDIDEIIERSTAEFSPQQKGQIRAAVLKRVRTEIEKAGAGELMPLFNKPTRQR